MGERERRGTLEKKISRRGLEGEEGQGVKPEGKKRQRETIERKSRHREKTARGKITRNALLGS